MILSRRKCCLCCPRHTEIVNKHDALVLLEQLTFCITVKTSMAEKWHCL